MYIICIKDLITISGAKLLSHILTITNVQLLLKNKTEVRIFVFALKNLIIPNQEFYVKKLGAANFGL